MLGNLDVDAGDDTWSLMLGDREVASGGRYDRVSFTLSHGAVSSVTAENVMDLGGPFSASPLPLADFQGLVTNEKLSELTHAPALLEAETTYFNSLLSTKTALADALKKDISASSHAAPSSFQSSMAEYPLEFAGFLFGSAMVGVVAMLGVARFLSPASGYNPVLDHSQGGAAAAAPRQGVGIEMEKPMKKLSADCEL
jgi:hypothetical protein